MAVAWGFELSCIVAYGRRAAVCSCLALVYVGAALLGFRHAIVAAQVTLVWPPSGIALGAVLLFGRWVWPGILLGAFAANLSTGMPVPAASVIAVGKETVIGQQTNALVRKYLPH